MTDQRDPRVVALIVELAESAPQAPSYAELEELLVEPEGPDQVHPIARPRSVWTRRPWLVAVAAAVAVLLMVGGAAWLLRQTAPESPVVTAPPTPSVTLPESTPATVPQVPETAGDWMRIVDEDAFPQRAAVQSPAINGIVIGGPGLVAVGRDITAPPSDQTQGTAPTTVPPGSLGDTAAVWISVDGIDWERVHHDESVLGGPGDQVMNDVVVAGPGLVAVGGESSFELGTTAVVWTSSDGSAWSRVHEEPGWSISAVTAGGPGLVAVGQSEFGAAVWTSTDGITWSQVSDGEGLFDEATMNDLTVGPRGLVAVGTGVWTSVDGISWSQAYQSEGPEMRAVSLGGPGLIAVGWNGSVWTSPDGTSWSRQPTDERTFAGTSHRLQEIAGGGLGVIVVAQAGLPGRGGLWTSADGVSWAPSHDGFLLEPASYMNDIIPTEKGLVVVGSAEEDIDPGPDARSVGSAAVWILTAEV